MKYKIPLSACIVYLILFILIQVELLPEFSNILFFSDLEETSLLYLFLFIIILLESIVYIGFYLPGQILAVLIIIKFNSGFLGIVILTSISIVAVIVGALINYTLGYYCFKDKKETKRIDWKKLLLSMVHINTLAFYMFEQGSIRGPRKLIFLTGLFNLPYYFLIITTTYYFKDSILKVAENPYFLFILLFIWLIYSITKDKKLIH